MSRDSSQIAPEGYRTHDFDWRFLLKKGDKVDFLDTEGNWILGDILDKRSIKGNVVEVLVGYSETEAKELKFEEWIPVFSLRLQK